MTGKQKGKGEPSAAHSPGISRRNLLQQAGKAAWVAPTLTVLSLPAIAQGPPDPPSPCFPNCPTGFGDGPIPANSKPRRPDQD